MALIQYKDAELGQCGGREITTTSSTTANANSYFYAIQFITTAIVTAQSNYASTPNPNLKSITSGFTAGTIVFGRFSAITLKEAGAAAIGYFAAE